jgi:hypothetical protein
MRQQSAYRESKCAAQCKQHQFRQSDGHLLSASCLILHGTAKHDGCCVNTARQGFSAAVAAAASSAAAWDPAVCSPAPSLVLVHGCLTVELITMRLVHDAKAGRCKSKAKTLPVDKPSAVAGPKQHGSSK